MIYLQSKSHLILTVQFYMFRVCLSNKYIVLKKKDSCNFEQKHPSNIITTKQSLNKQHYKSGLIVWYSINDCKKYKIAYDNVVSSWHIESGQKKNSQNSQTVIFSKLFCAEYY